MDTNTKVLLALLSGAGFGALVSFALLKEKFDERLKTELETQEEYYKDKIEASKPKKKEINDSADGDEDEVEYVNYTQRYSSDKNEDTRPGLKEQDKETTDQDYFDSLDEVEQEDFDPLDTEYYSDTEEEQVVREPDGYDEPYVISVQEFNDECLDMDKITLTYYEDDDILTDEHDDVLQNVETVIGDESLDHFGYSPSEPDIVHVRNIRLGADYEVCRVPGSYTETILGILDGPFTRQPRTE